MRNRLSLSLAAALATLAACAAPPADHSAHAVPAGAAPAACDAHHAEMRAMHDKMMAAKTPQEREALHAEHMRARQAMPGMAAASAATSGMGGGMAGGMGGGMGRGIAMAAGDMGHCQAMRGRGMPASAPATK